MLQFGRPWCTLSHVFKMRHVDTIIRIHPKYIDPKGCFKRWSKVARRRNLNYLIGGEQKFVLWACSSEAVLQRRMPSKGLCPPKCLHDNTFWDVWRQEFLLSTKSLGKMRMETRTMVKKRNYGTKSFSSQLKIWGVWATISRLVGHRVKQP